MGKLSCLYWWICVGGGVVFVCASTPLCMVCPCNSEPNQPPAINCANTKVSDIYARRYWFDDDARAPYPIASLAVRLDDALATPFLASDLRLLDLGGGSIRSVAKGVFAALQSMDYLDLGRNELARIHPDAFRGVYDKSEYFPLKSLKTLDLRWNKIHTLDADTFEHVDEIEILVLRGNPFKVIDAQTLSAIASLAQLRILDMAYTQIKILPDHFLHTPMYLVTLDLSGNRFEVVPSALGESHALEILYLGKNPIANISGTNVFPRISTLKILRLSRMPSLNEIGAKAFGALPNLRELYLAHNARLTKIHEDAFAGEDACQLRKLYIQFANISSCDVATHLRSLSEMEMRGNPLSCDCLIALLPIREIMQDVNELTCHDKSQARNFTFHDMLLQYEPIDLEEEYDNRTFLYFTASDMGRLYFYIGILAVVVFVMIVLNLHCYKKLRREIGDETTCAETRCYNRI